MIRRAVAMVVVTGLLSWGCGDGESSPASTAAAEPGIATTTSAAGTTAAPPTTTGAAEPATGWLSLLERIPATEETILYVMLNDYAAAREAAGIPLPGPAASDDLLADYMIALSMGTSSPLAATFDTFGQRLPSREEWETAFGLSVLDVDRVATAGFPPRELFVWEGSIVPERVSAAVESDPVWSERLTTVESPSGSFYQWGDDPAAVDPDMRDSVRPLGRGGCLAAVDGLALRTIYPDTMASALSAIAGESPSLADVEPLRLIAEALDAQDTYAAYLTADSGQFIPDPNLLGDGPTEQTTLNPYLALGTGAGLDGNGEAYMVVVLVHQDADDAAANADRFAEIVTTGLTDQGGPWSDLLTLRSITTEGPVLVAVLDTGTLPSLWYRIVLMRETLLTWG